MYNKKRKIRGTSFECPDYKNNNGCQSNVSPDLVALFEYAERQGVSVEDLLGTLMPSESKICKPRNQLLCGTPSGDYCCEKSTNRPPFWQSRPSHRKETKRLSEQSTPSLIPVLPQRISGGPSYTPTTPAVNSSGFPLPLPSYEEQLIANQPFNFPTDIDPETLAALKASLVTNSQERERRRLAKLQEDRNSVTSRLMLMSEFKKIPYRELAGEEPSKEDLTELAGLASLQERTSTPIATPIATPIEISTPTIASPIVETPILAPIALPTETPVSESLGETPQDVRRRKDRERYESWKLRGGKLTRRTLE
jgi:hypothetical protein